jgi:ribosome-associated toxin RatA of RatAB toxin-antitoxin module
MAKVSRTEVYDVGVDDFYKVIVDYDSYPEFVDGVNEVEVLEQDESGARVKYSLNLIKKFSYILKLEHSVPNKVSWALESGDLFKKNIGSWDLKDLGDGKLEVIYSVDLEFKGFAPKAIVNKLVNHNLPAMMNSYFERAK